MLSPDLKPSDRAEEIAIFRATLLGPVMLRDLAHGQLANKLRVLSEARYRPPGATSTRTYQVPTLERWLYAYRARGLAGLRPEPRSDRGFAQELSEELRALLLDIRREHPSASVSLILAVLTEEGSPFKVTSYAFVAQRSWRQYSTLWRGKWYTSPIPISIEFSQLIVVALCDAAARDVVRAS